MVLGFGIFIYEYNYSYFPGLAIFMQFFHNFKPNLYFQMTCMIYLKILSNNFALFNSKLLIA